MEIRVLAGLLFLSALIICRLFTYVRPSPIMFTFEIAAYAICAFILLYAKSTRVKTIKIKPGSEKIVIEKENCAEKEYKQTKKSNSPRKIESSSIPPQRFSPIELKKINVLPAYDSVRVPSLLNSSSAEIEHKDISKYSEKYLGLNSELINQFESIDSLTKAEYNGLTEYAKKSRKFDHNLEERLSVKSEIVESYNAIIEEITQELNRRFADEEELMAAEKLKIEEENRISAQKIINEEKSKFNQQIEIENIKIAKEKQAYEENQLKRNEKIQLEDITVKSILTSNFSTQEPKPLDILKPASKVSITEVKQENAKQPISPLIPPKPNQQETIKTSSKEPQISEKVPSMYSQDREVPFITPELPSYKERMEKLLSVYDESRHKADSSPSNIKDDLNATVNQISNDSDIEHLNRRVEIAINVLKELNAEQRENALCLLCERVTSAVQDKCDSIAYGPGYTLTFIDFILAIGKTYPEIRKMFFFSIIIRRKILVPIYGAADPEKIMKRLLLNDLNEDFNNDMCIAEMNISRAYGILLASFYTHKESPCNVGDCWRWLSFFLNIPEEYIDRNYIPTLEGFLKVSGPFMKQHYSSQYSKIVSFLKDTYLPMIKNRFSVRYQYKTFITHLQKVINEL